MKKQDRVLKRLFQCSDTYKAQYVDIHLFSRKRDRRTDGRANGQTDGPGYRDAKREIKKKRERKKKGNQEKKGKSRIKEYKRKIKEKSPPPPPLSPAIPFLILRQEPLPEVRVVGSFGPGDKDRRRCRGGGGLEPRPRRRPQVAPRGRQDRPADQLCCILQTAAGAGIGIF